MEVTNITNKHPSNIETMHKAARECPIGTGSKIDHYGLGAHVTELRSAGLSGKAIAAEINAKYIKNMDKVSPMAVLRWLKKNYREDEAIVVEESTVNIYKQQCNMLDVLNSTLETVEAMLDDFRSKMSDKDVSISDLKDLTLTLTKIAAQKQSLINSIEVTQEKIYNYMAVNRIVNTIINFVKEKDLNWYFEVKEEIAKDAMLVEAFRRIKE